MPRREVKSNGPLPVKLGRKRAMGKGRDTLRRVIFTDIISVGHDGKIEHMTVPGRTSLFRLQVMTVSLMFCPEEDDYFKECITIDIATDGDKHWWGLSDNSKCIRSIGKGDRRHIREVIREYLDSPAP